MATFEIHWKAEPLSFALHWSPSGAFSCTRLKSEFLLKREHIITFHSLFLEILDTGTWES